MGAIKDIMNKWVQAVLMIRRRHVFFLMLLCLVSCDKIDFLSRPYVATVNGAKIYLDEYQVRLNQKMTMLPKGLDTEDRRLMSRLEEEVLEEMITEKIIELRAKELGISVGASEVEERIHEIKKDYGEDFASRLAQQNIRYDQWKEELRKELLVQKLVAVDVNAHIRVSDDEAEDYYNDHRDRYREGARVRAAQIVVRDRETAQEIWNRLKDGEDFAALASKYSIGPEAIRGGDLGYLTRGEMPDPLDETIFRLPVNKISPVVQSPYGFHIVKVSEIMPARVKSFAEVKDEIIAEIRAQKEEAAYINWLNALKLAAVVKKDNTVLR